MHRPADRCALSLYAAIIAVASCVHPSRAQLDAGDLYNGVSRPVHVSIRVPEGLSGEPSIALLSPGEALDEARTAPVEPGQADLSALFPVLWTTNEPSVRYAQLVVGDDAVGSPLVIEPLLTPVRARDGFTDSLLEAAETREDGTLRELARLSSESRDARRQRVELEQGSRVFSGYRIYPKRDVILDTSLGEVRISTRPDAAPKASYTFVHLAGGGFYDGVVFHRVVTDDGRGRPFVIQSGDPTGRGWGGAGFFNDFERSDLAHDFGVLSVARRPFDPNTNGSQFFICLSREACAPLDGLYTSFAEVVSGASVIDAMTTLDMVTKGEGDEAVPTDRPVEPPVIERAYLVPAPSADRSRARVTPDDAEHPSDRR